MKAGKLCEIFYDTNGKLSYGRVIGFFVLFWYMVIATYLSLKKQELPDIPAGVAGLLAILYGINKGAQVMANRGGTKQ